MSNFLKLANSFGIKVKDKFSNILVNECSYDEQSNSVELGLEYNEKITETEMKKLVNDIKKGFNKHFDKALINLYCNNIIYESNFLFSKLKLIAKNQLNDSNLFNHLQRFHLESKQNDSNIIDLVTDDDVSYNYVKTFKLKLIECMSQEGISNCEIKLEKSQLNHTIIEDSHALNSAMQSYVENSVKPVNEEKQFSKFKNSFTPLTNLEFYESMEHDVCLEGRIFKFDIAKSKKGNYYATIEFTDETEAISAIAFAKTKEEFSELGINKYIQAFGSNNNDRNGNKQLVIRKYSIKNVYESKRLDTSNNKHTELGFHTKMSTMDGIATPEEIIEQAKRFKHKYIGVTDTNSVQHFPTFYQLTKKDKDLNVIYGISLSVIKTKEKVLLNSNENNIVKTHLKDITYVSFDLETTGFAPIVDDIIEFGAALISEGKIKEKYQFFIKTNREISSKITELTGISNADLINGYEIKEALLKIKDIFKDYVVLAHNAGFDLGFLKQKGLQFGIKFDNIFLDTLQVSYLLNIDEKSHNLGRVAQRHQIVYDSNVAHRGDYDADVLAKTWIIMISRLVDLNITTLEELDNYQVDGYLKKQRENEIKIWIKKQAGLKELYKIISSALTEYFYDPAKYPIESLKLSDNLISSSGGVDGPIYETLFTRDEEELSWWMDQVEYIELVPLSGLSHKFVDNSREDIIVLVKKLISMAKNKNKKIIVSASPRYVNPNDKIVHEVYIEASGIKNKRNKLFSYRAKDEVKYPDMHFFTTTELFDDFKDLQLDEHELLEYIVLNPNSLAASVEKIKILPDKLYTPEFDNSKVKLKELVYENAYKQYGNPLPENIASRIERELTPILKYGFDVIYWISTKLVAKTNADGHIVGSRGSVGSSIVATLSKITEINPLEPHYYCTNCKYIEFVENPPTSSGFDLDDKICHNCNIKLRKDGQTIPFETFLGFDADKVPDIDLNFTGDYQATIHNEVRELFGEAYTYRAGTISAAASKTAYGYLMSHFDNKSKKPSDAYINYLLTKAEKVKRTTGQHPGGIIVIPKQFEVEDFTPINYPAENLDSDWKTIHFDYRAIHDNLLKLDLLGHKDPKALEMLLRITNIKVEDIPTKDEAVIKIFSSLESLNIKPEDINGEKTGALGIPEFGTEFVRGMLWDIKPKSFSDLVAVSGLSHGIDVWLNNGEILVKQKGYSLEEVITTRDEMLRKLTKMGVENKLSFNIMEKVRKGKGISDEERQIMTQHGVNKDYIDSMDKIKYLFPRAHAAAYAFMAWRVAYFKVHHPLEYYATYFTVRTEHFDIKSMIGGKSAIDAKIKELQNQRSQTGKALSSTQSSILQTLYIAQEASARGIKFAILDLDKSLAIEWIFDKENNVLIPPFSVVDGLGAIVAENIIKARQERPYKTIDDFVKRSGANKNSVNLLMEISVFDEIAQEEQNTLW
ncbi:PolC-type DNA polymerase III [Mycoplasma testudineum]|nr:PolC-type DNA polymerase III [Mycoplasma testudineum]